MHLVKKGLITLAATAAVLAPAALAGASTQGASTPVNAASSLGCVGVCVNIIGDNVSYNNVAASVATVLCPNLSLAQITQLGIGQSTVCTLTSGAAATLSRIA